MSDVDEKLRRGFGLIERARLDSDLLGVALLAIQGALEDHLRSILTTYPRLTTEERQSLVRRETPWQRLTELAQKCAVIDQDQRRLLQEAEDIRQAFAHGRPFRWRVSDVLRYGRIVERLCEREGMLEEVMLERRPERGAEPEPPRRVVAPPPRRAPIPFGTILALALFVAIVAGGIILAQRVNIDRVVGALGVAPPGTAVGAPTSQPAPTPVIRRATIVNLGGGPGWLHESPNLDSNTLPVRLGEGMTVTLLEPEQASADGVLWRYVSVGGYQGWCPSTNLAPQQ